jgi:hypothetical protein
VPGSATVPELVLVVPELVLVVPELVEVVPELVDVVPLLVVELVLELELLEVNSKDP